MKSMPAEKKENEKKKEKECPGDLHSLVQLVIEGPLDTLVGLAEELNVEVFKRQKTAEKGNGSSSCCCGWNQSHN